MFNVAILSFVLAGNLAYVHQGNIWIKSLPNGPAHQVSRGGGASNLQWSPSGNWLKFEQNGKIILLSKTGVSKELTAEQSVWSSGRDELAFIDRDGLCVVSLEGAEEQKRVVLSTTPRAQISGFAWSPDSTTFAVSIVSPDPAGRPEFRTGQLWRVGIDGLQPQEIFTPKERGGVSPIGWSSDGQYILAEVDPDFSASLAADGLPLVAIPVFGGTARNLAANVLAHPGFVSVTERSREVLVVSGLGRETWSGKRLTVIDPATAKTTELTDEKSAVLTASGSSDGNRIAYVAGPDIKESQHVAVGTVIAPNGRASRQPVREGGDSFETTMRQRRIWLFDADGNRRQLTSDQQYRDEYPIWTPDGSSIVFVRIDRENKASIWALTLANGTLEKIVDDVDGIDSQTGSFGYYGYIDWSRYVTVSPQ